jgi:hypothetical protein
MNNTQGLGRAALQALFCERATNPTSKYRLQTHKLKIFTQSFNKIVLMSSVQGALYGNSMQQRPTITHQQL